MLQKLSFLFFLIIISLRLKSQEPDSLRKGIHQLEKEYYSKLLPEEKQSTEKVTAIPSNLITTGTRTLTRKVLGWYPYWAPSSAYLSFDYSALSHIAYFSYEVDTATGGYTTIHDWNTTPIVDFAHQRGTKVLLTVTNFGSSGNTEILSDSLKQKFMINTIISLLKSRNGDGVNFDFESVSNTQRVNLVNFTKRAIRLIKTELPASEISMASPAVDWAGSWDLKTLSELCDYLIVMGYDYYWSGSSTAGPVAPLEGENYNVSKTVYNYINSGVSPRKLLLGVPWYGYDWPVVNNSRKATATGAAAARIYAAANQLADSYGKIFDQTTKVQWVSYLNSSLWRQLWFDDTLSLSMKYNLVNAQNLGGIAIWALSYEGGYKDIWEKIISAFPAKDESVNKIINIYPNPVSGISRIDFFLINKEYVTLKVFDLLGKERMVLINGELAAGFHSEEFSPDGYGTGIYFCVLTNENSKSTWKIVVIKK